MTKTKNLLGDLLQNNTILGAQETKNYPQYLNEIFRMFQPTLPSKKILKLLTKHFDLMKMAATGDDLWSSSIQSYQKGGEIFWPKLINLIFLYEIPHIYRSLAIEEYFPQFTTTFNSSHYQFFHPLFLSGTQEVFRPIKYSLHAGEVNFGSILGPILPQLYGSYKDQLSFAVLADKYNSSIDWEGMPLSRLTFDLLFGHQEILTMEKWKQIILNFHPMAAFNLLVFDHQKQQQFLYIFQPFKNTIEQKVIESAFTRPQFSLVISPSFNFNQLIFAYTQKNFRLVYFYLQNLIDECDKNSSPNDYYFYRLSFYLLQAGHNVFKEDIYVANEKIESLLPELKKINQHWFEVAKDFTQLIQQYTYIPWPLNKRELKGKIFVQKVIHFFKSYRFIDFENKKFITPPNNHRL